MSEDKFIRKEALIAPGQPDLDDRTAFIGARMSLPRAPRVTPLNRSYCAETAWVWQRARLVCAVKKPTA